MKFTLRKTRLLLGSETETETETKKETESDREKRTMMFRDMQTDEQAGRYNKKRKSKKREIEKKEPIDLKQTKR